MNILKTIYVILTLLFFLKTLDWNLDIYMKAIAVDLWMYTVVEKSFVLHIILAHAYVNSEESIITGGSHENTTRPPSKVPSLAHLEF